MKRLTLTREQLKKIEQAKQAGKQRIVITLTESQRKADRDLVEAVDREKVELIRQARSERNKQRQQTKGLADRLREIRESAGLSLADVAERAGMTRQAVYRIESGENCNPKLDTIQRIAEALGKSVMVEVH